MRVRYRHYKSGNARLLSTPQQKFDNYSKASFKPEAHDRVCINCQATQTREIKKKDNYNPSPLWYRVRPHDRTCTDFLCYKCHQHNYAVAYWAKNKEVLKAKWRKKQRRLRRQRMLNRSLRRWFSTARRLNSARYQPRMRR